MEWGPAWPVARIPPCICARRACSQAPKAGLTRGAPPRPEPQARHEVASRVGPDRSCRTARSAAAPKSATSCHLARERRT